MMHGFQKSAQTHTFSGKLKAKTGHPPKQSQHKVRASLCVWWVLFLQSCVRELGLLYWLGSFSFISRRAERKSHTTPAKKKEGKFSANFQPLSLHSPTPGPTIPQVEDGVADQDVNLRDIIAPIPDSQLGLRKEEVEEESHDSSALHDAAIALKTVVSKKATLDMDTLAASLGVGRKALELRLMALAESCHRSQSQFLNDISQYVAELATASDLVPVSFLQHSLFDETPSIVCGGTRMANVAEG